MANFAVFFGGRSNEREISVITGLFCANLLRTTSHNIIPVYLLPEGGMATGEFKDPASFAEGLPARARRVNFSRRSLTEEGKKRPFVQIDAALNCCHGGMGEDGTLSALLRWYEIPSASPDMPVSAVFMDKTLTKIAAKGLGLPTARAFSVFEREYQRDSAPVFLKAERLGYPLVVKPARLGSSIGVKVATCQGELEMALALAFHLDDAALVEEFISGRRDINCAARVLGGNIELSELEEVFSDEDILTFSEKYERRGGHASERPAQIPAPLAEQIHDATRTLCTAFRITGVVRADFIVSGEQVYFNELNTVPGSLACHLFSKTLSESRDFLLSLLQSAQNEAPMSKDVLSSGILKGNFFSGRKGGKR